MRAFIKLFALLMALFGGVVMLIKLLYGATWRESIEIADQFIEDLLG